jgi:hypothetical protein
MTKRLSSTRRLFLLVDKLDDRMAELAAKKRTRAEDTEFCNTERRYWPLQSELLRRLSERDELRIEIDQLLKPSPIVADRIQREIETHFSSPLDLAHYVVDLLTTRDKRIAKLATDLSVAKEEIARLAALAGNPSDRIARLQALHAANPGVKPWSSDREPGGTK